MIPLWTVLHSCVDGQQTFIRSFIKMYSLLDGCLHEDRVRSYLSEASAGRGWGSVNTCSVNGPGGPSSVWLVVDSGTSVASVASSADWAG